MPCPALRGRQAYSGFHARATRSASALRSNRSARMRFAPLSFAPMSSGSICPCSASRFLGQAAWRPPVAQSAAERLVDSLEQALVEIHDSAFVRGLRPVMRGAPPYSKFRLDPRKRPRFDPQSPGKRSGRECLSVLLSRPFRSHSTSWRDPVGSVLVVDTNQGSMAAPPERK